jgi:hypothetical protein
MCWDYRSEPPRQTRSLLRKALLCPLFREREQWAPGPAPCLTPPPCDPAPSLATPLTRAPIALGGVAALQVVERVVVVEPGGAWAARKDATASDVVLIAQASWGRDVRGEGQQSVEVRR